VTARGVAPILAVLSLGLVVAGCRSFPRAGVTLPGVPLAIDDARAEQVLAAHLARVDARTGLRGSARVALRGPDFKLNRPQRVVVERPARLRFEVVGLFDQLAAVLVTDGEVFGFYDASTGEILRGAVSPDLLWDLARIDLAPAEAVGLLLGAPAPGAGLARAAVWLEDGTRIALGFAAPGPRAADVCRTDDRRALVDPVCFLAPAALEAGGEIFVFDEAGRLVELRALGPQGAVRHVARFEAFEATGSVADEGEDAQASASEAFAHRVTIRSPEVGAEARFDWKRVMFDGPISDRFFVLPDPRGASLGGGGDRSDVRSSLGGGGDRSDVRPSLGGG